MQQNLITIVASVRHADKLRPMLTNNRWNPLLSMLPSLHFSSMTMTEDGKPWFIWESNFDGPIDAYLQLVTEVPRLRQGLVELYQHCFDYQNARSLYEFLKDHVVKPRIAHIGAPGLSVRRIKDEYHLREKVEEFLDALTPGSMRSGAAVQEYLRRRVLADPNLRWAELPEGRLPWWSVAWRWIRFVVLTAALVAVLLILLPIWALAALCLRLVENCDKPDGFDQEKYARHLDKIRLHEDGGVQNHLAAVTEIKGRRRLLLRFLLWSGSFYARLQTKGTLGGIPGIFFAHWSLIDDDSKLLFVTNYSGSWDGYLDDFIDLASWGLTPVWTNTDGFPRTRLLFFGGSRNRRDFKRFVRWHQLETLVWYRAYPEPRVENVNRNSAIRDGLFRRMDHREQAEWLRLL